MTMRTLFAAAAMSLVAFAAPALAQSAPDPVIEAARADGQVGEQADGYLGVRDANASADLRARVQQNNIKRRAYYTETATQRGATVEAMGAALACEQIARGRIAPGHWYRTEAQEWRQRIGDGPVQKPSYCP
jgi:uncharacterized protein YdbL (DUF1318 family)